MYYPEIPEDGNTRTFIDTWKGYNHNFRTQRGEFFDMQNLTSDYYPLLAPRKIRPLLAQAQEEKFIRGLLYSDNNLAYLEGTTLHYSTQEIDLSDYMEEPEQEDWQTLLRFGAYILIFPAAVYVNVYDTEDIGEIRTKYSAASGITITYTICDAEGNGFSNITASETAPENPTDGQYWLCTREGEQGLNIWHSSLSMWQPVATCYIRIDIPGATLTEYFETGDTVTMNTTLPDINNGSQIKAMTDESLVVIGLLKDGVTKTDTTSDAWTLTLERKIPRLDYVCCDKNRVWGCHYGYSEGRMINEIYASKLGDFKNWYTYQGLSTDSYSVSVGVPGQWTGCISYRGCPVFFKENAIFKIYGSYPAEYQLQQSDQRGVQAGSYRSLAIVDEYLVYKSASDICSYDGSVPVSISEALGHDRLYYDAVGGGCLNKYRVEMEDAQAKKYHFIYDFKYGIWEKEDACGFKQFSATENGQIYGATKEKVFGLGSTDNVAYIQSLVSEEWVDWFATTGEMGFEYADYKYVSRLTVRAYVPTRSELEVQIRYDDKPFETIGVLRGNDDVLSQSLAFSPMRCDHFQIKFRGHGDCRIYTMAITLETGSEEDGH